MERRTFEDSLKDVFKDAEATPSDKVWTNVELELERETGSTMRRRLAFYQLLAAAAVTLALLSSGVAYFVINNRDTTIEQMVAASRVLPAEGNDQAIGQKSESGLLPGVSDDPRPSNAPGNLARAGADDSAIKHTDQSAAEIAQGRSVVIERSGARRTLAAAAAQPELLAYSGGRERGESTVTPASENNNTAIASSPLVDRQTVARQRALPAFFTPIIQRPSVQKDEVDPVAAMMAKLAEEEMKLAANDQKKKDVSDEKVWTSLGVAAGGFSAVNHGASPVQSMGLAAYNNTSVPDKQAKASGVAYSMGLSFGTKVARRWVIQGGVNYLTQSSNYVATNVIAGPNYQSLQAESINALGKLPALADAASASDRLAPTVPYSVNNNLKFFSLPMQAGYLLVNRKFGVQLNAGLSTDLFLENTITPEGGSLDKTTQSNGSESPYRTVNFSGLMGTEFSYRLGQRYRIALNPALRYPLNSVYKSDVGIESTPLTFDVGLRFRYIFK
ncbi:MAG TPA: outer membrane beta-barrel protein [Chryseolinea sp.]|nr:outer membrane beta-barrel protein [Chryseolinea sp.]